MDLKIDLASFSSMEKSLDTDHVYDVLILGGGPAALNAVLYAARKKIDIGVITDDIGGQIVKSSSIENWIGDTEIKSSSLINKFYNHIESFKPVIKKNTLVVSTDLSGSIKKISCNDGNTYQAKTVIIATGKMPRKLGISGEEEFTGKGVAYCTTCDGPMFADKKIVVVGGGNSGVEAALDMLNYASHVVVIQNLEKLTADPVLVEKLLADKRVEVYYNAVCERIEGHTEVESLVIKDTSTAQEHKILTDGVFIEIGLIPVSNFLPAQIKNKFGEVEVNSACETSIAGVFAAGDVTTVPFKQVVIAAGEGAKAALSASAYILKNM